MMKYIFDLDGTITKKETLPIIAKHFGVEKEINEMTVETIKGNIPFIESFIKRVFILGKFSIKEVNMLLGKVPIYDQIHEFILKNQNDCIIATGNLCCWIEKLANKIGCKTFCSECDIIGDKVKKLTKILRKEDIVIQYQSLGYKVIFIGDGNNDLEAMRIADISIASGYTHQPASSVLTVADYLVYEESSLCQLLNQLS